MLYGGKLNSLLVCIGIIGFVLQNFLIHALVWNELLRKMGSVSQSAFYFSKDDVNSKWNYHGAYTEGQRNR